MMWPGLIGGKLGYSLLQRVSDGNETGTYCDSSTYTDKSKLQHLFSVFPWAHLIFTERALLRWRADFKSDGATRFHEAEGGLNQISVRQFKKLVLNDDFLLKDLNMLPIRGMHWLSNPMIREFVTSVIHCVLVRAE